MSCQEDDTKIVALSTGFRRSTSTATCTLADKEWAHAYHILPRRTYRTMTGTVNVVYAMRTMHAECALCLHHIAQGPCGHTYADKRGESANPKTTSQLFRCRSPPTVDPSSSAWSSNLPAYSSCRSISPRRSRRKSARHEASAPASSTASA